MAAPRDDPPVQSPTSTEKPAMPLPSHANTLPADLKLSSKFDKPPMLKHMYIHESIGFSF